MGEQFGQCQSGENLQNDPFQEATAADGCAPITPGQMRRQWLCRRPDPVDLEFVGQVENSAQHHWNQMDVLMPIQADSGFTGEVPIARDLTSDAVLKLGTDPSLLLRQQ